MPPSRLSLSIEPHGTRCSRERALAWVQMRVVTRGAWPECPPAADGCPESIVSGQSLATCPEPSLSGFWAGHSFRTAFAARLDASNAGAIIGSVQTASEVETGF